MSKKKASPAAEQQQYKSTVIPEEEYVPQERPKKTYRFMTLFEFTALVTARATQLLSTHTPQVDPAKYNYRVDDIARAEVLGRNIRLVIRRELPNGETEDFHAWEMEFPPL